MFRSTIRNKYYFNLKKKVSHVIQIPVFTLVMPSNGSLLHEHVTHHIIKAKRRFRKGRLQLKCQRPFVFRISIQVLR